MHLRLGVAFRRVKSQGERTVGMKLRLSFESMEALVDSLYSEILSNRDTLVNLCNHGYFTVSSNAKKIRLANEIEHSEKVGRYNTTIIKTRFEL